MSIVKPFRGLRPVKELAEKVASPPYDVLDSNEAREMAKGDPLTFLHVNKPEIDLDPDTDPYDPKVYNECREPSAEVVREKERANFCEYFEAGSQEGAAAQKKDLLSAAEALFKKK